MPKYEKMSKSKGNVITVDEVVCEVYDVANGYELRDINNEGVEPKYTTGKLCHE